MKSNFHYLARGVILIDGKLLLAHQIDADNTFLSGGHIRSEEKAEVALALEKQEEIGQVDSKGMLLQFRVNEHVCGAFVRGPQCADG